MSKEDDPLRELEEELKGLAEGVSRALEKVRELRARPEAPSPAGRQPSVVPTDAAEDSEESDMGAEEGGRLAIDALADLEQPFTAQQACETLPTWSRRSVFRWLRQAIKEGIIEKAGYGAYQVVQATPGSPPSAS